MCIRDRHVASRLLERGDTVVGIDNLNKYYDVSLKTARNDILKGYKNFKFEEVGISDKKDIELIFEKVKPQKVVNLAAQAGVRYSLENPNAYIKANIEGFMNILECCRYHNVEGLVYASSSSVYGGNKKMPFLYHFL